MKLPGLLVFCFQFMGFIAGFSQPKNHEIGIEGGPDTRILYGNEVLNSFHHLSVGYSGGLFYQYNHDRILSLRSNISIERKGSVWKGPTVDGGGQQNLSTEVHLNFQYLTLPLLVRATFGNSMKFVVNAGPYIGFLLQQTEVFKGTDGQSYRSNNTSLYKRFDWGISAGLGLSFPISEQFSLSMELRDNLGLYNIASGKVINNGTIKNNSTNFLFGMAYKFGKLTAPK